MIRPASLSCVLNVSLFKVIALISHLGHTISECKVGLATGCAALLLSLMDRPDFLSMVLIRAYNSMSTSESETGADGLTTHACRAGADIVSEGHLVKLKQSS